MNEIVAKILYYVTLGGIGQREAAWKYGIPSQNHSGKVGLAQIFSPTFVQHCISVSEMGIPISMYDLRCIVKSYLDSTKRKVSCFTNNMPGWEWGKHF